MANTLYIYLQAERAATGIVPSYPWILRDSLGNPRGTGTNTLNDIAEQLTEAYNGVAILPATEASSYLGKIPANIAKKGEKQWAKVLPFALEEQLGEDLDNLHFAYPSKSAVDYDNLDANIPVTVIQKQCLEDWLKQLSTAGIQCKTMVLDADCLNPGKTHIAAIITQQHSIAKNHLGQQVSCANSLFEQLLPLLGSPKQQKLRLQFFGYSTEQAQQLHDNLQAQGWDASERGLWEQSQQDLVKYLTQNLSSQDSTNLLQGNYAVKSENAINLKPWLMSIGLLVTAGLLALATQIFTTSQLQKRNQQLDAQIEQQFSKSLPGRKRIPGKERWLIKQALGSNSNGSNKALTAVDYIEQLSEATAGLPDIQPISMQYRKGNFDVKLRAASILSVEKLKQQLSALDKVSADVGSTNVEGDSIDIKLRLTAKVSP